MLLLAGCGSGKTGDASASDSTGSAAVSADKGSDSGSGQADASGDEESDEDSGSAKKPKPKTTSVNASRVIRGNLVIPVIAEGSIRARNAADIHAEVSGRIQSIPVKEGQTVRKGTLIARLDDREYRVALEEARSSYLEALGRLAVDEDTLNSDTADAALQDRISKLDAMLAEGTITAAEHSERKLALEVEAVKHGAHRSELVQVRSGLAAARAAREKAELNLERTEIRAPFGGVISDLKLTAGQNITPGDLVCNLVDNVNLEAEVAVLESDLKGLEVGRPVRLQIPAIAETLAVKVDVMSPRLDADSRTCNLLMRFQDPDGRVRPGMFARASIAGEILPDRLLVPREAILTRDGRPLLFKVESNKAEWVYVELGKSNDRFVEVAKILQGGPLEPGTPVVVSDHLTLTHDAPVKIRKILDADVAWALDDDEQ